MCPKHVLLRFGWLLDDSNEGILGRFLARAERDAELMLADDRRGNPTPVDDAARVMLAVLKQLDCAAPLWGTYHYGGHEATTTLALGQAVLTEARNLRALKVQEITPGPRRPSRCGGRAPARGAGLQKSSIHSASSPARGARCPHSWTVTTAMADSPSSLPAAPLHRLQPGRCAAGARAFGARARRSFHRQAQQPAAGEPARRIHRRHCRRRRAGGSRHGRLQGGGAPGRRGLGAGFGG